MEPVTPGRGDSNVDRLRERFREQIEQGRQESNPGSRTRPEDSAPKSDLLKDRPRVPARDTNQPDQPDTNAPALPNLESLRDRQEPQRREMRKPDLSNPENAETKRLRDRLKNQDRDGNRPQQPTDPSEALPEGDARKPDVTGRRRPGDALKIERNTLDRLRNSADNVQEQSREVRPARSVEDLQRQLEQSTEAPEVRNVLKNTQLQLTDFAGAFQTRITKGSFQNLTRTEVGREYDLDQQFTLFATGDVTRQLNLHQTLIQNGGWSQRTIGRVYPQYSSAHFSAWYPGPGWYPPYCWTPTWSAWVRWTFWDYCRPIYDPRPIYCRPIYYYDPCPPLVYYNFPVWRPLPVVTCGTWVDVPVTVVSSGHDVQLLAVRFVDPGHPEENLGPRYRIWIRNNANRPISSPFNVTLVAANDDQLTEGLPQAGVIVESMEPKAVVPVDVRLPMEVNRLNRSPDGKRTPFTTLHVLADSHRELEEVEEANNGLTIARSEILPVDPAAFSTESPIAVPGEMVTLAGEGFGPEPGQLLIVAGDESIPAEIHGWYDLGVHFRMPKIDSRNATKADIVVIRGDGAASNPVTVELANEGLAQH